MNDREIEEHKYAVVTKSGTGTWDVGRGDVGTRGRGDAGTWGREDVGTRGRGDVGTWAREVFGDAQGFEDVINRLRNKQIAY